MSAQTSWRSLFVEIALVLLTLAMIGAILVPIFFGGNVELRGPMR